jgi:hypothetical protein
MIASMKRPSVIGAGILVAIMLAAHVASADPASQETGPVLTHKQVLQIALTEAKRSADPHPKRIEMASGSLKVATSVTDPTGRLGSGVNEKEAVDLVVMHGHFQVNGSPPLGRHIAPGKVLELIVGAHTGFVQELTSGNDVPVPLSHLGPVTRLR